MITLGNANSPVSKSVLYEPGGFAWWYAEILDEQGNGAVVIWSFGLPFLPVYKSDNDRGTKVLPAARPSLNVALYERGEPSFYLLHEFARDDVVWNDQHSWRFGNNKMTVSDQDGERSLRVSFDCPVADGQDRLRGTLTLSGVIPYADENTSDHSGASEHHWTPLALPARGEFLLHTSDYRLQVSGDAYFDRNASEQALHHLGIEFWLWGHAPTEDGNRIFYVLWEKDNPRPLTLGYEVDARGQLTERRDLTPVFEQQRRTVYGMRTWKRVELFDHGKSWMHVELTRCVDNGPFYLRYITDTRVPDATATVGSAEVINPSRVDLLRHRPLVRMRVSRDTGHNSIWLPLFEGAKQTRIRRLLESPIRKVLGR